MISFLHSKQSTLRSAAILIAGAALASRLLGLVRDRILTSTFGAGNELDVYFAAFRIPDFVFQFFFAGALSAAFIPIFIEAYQKRREYAWSVTANAFNVLGAFLGAGVALGILYAPFLVRLVAPGFDGEKQELTILLSRIMLIGPLMLGLSAIFSSVNQALDRFWPYALAPILYNVGIIIGAVVFVPLWGLGGLAWGVVLGSVIHFLIQFPPIFAAGFRFSALFSWRKFEFIRMVRLMLPRSVALVASQINLWAITALASLLSAGSVAIFNLANNLQYLPIGIIGLSFATASFPALSRAASGDQRERFMKTFVSVVQQILFIVLPASVLLYVLRAQVVRVVYGAGLFGWEDTRLTAAVLGIFCFGIFAHSLIPAIARAFYAMQDTMTPLVVNVGGVLLNIILGLLFTFILFQDGMASFLGGLLRVNDLSNIPILGLPLAFVISGVVTCVILAWIFFYRYGNMFRGDLVSSFLRLSILSLGAGFASYAALRPILLLPFVSLDSFWGVFFQGLGAGFVGIAVYAGGLFLLKFPERKFLSQLSKIFGASV